MSFRRSEETTRIGFRLCSSGFPPAYRQKQFHVHHASGYLWSKKTIMRVVRYALLGVQLLGLHTALAAEGKFLVELNSIEPAESRCRLNFVIENKSDAAVDSMKLDL